MSKNRIEKQEYVKPESFADKTTKFFVDTFKAVIGTSFVTQNTTDMTPGAIYKGSMYKGIDKQEKLMIKSAINPFQHILIGVSAVKYSLGALTEQDGGIGESSARSKVMKSLIQIPFTLIETPIRLARFATNLVVEGFAAVGSAVSDLFSSKSSKINPSEIIDSTQSRSLSSTKSVSRSNSDEISSPPSTPSLKSRNSSMSR